MKIKFDNQIYYIPPNTGICILAGNHLDQCIQLIQKYYLRNKKNEVAILDGDDHLISPDDTCFLHIENNIDLKSIFEFKSKTMLNNEFTEFIGKNQELFQSIEMIRSELTHLLTDSGFYKLRKILENGTDIQIKYHIDDFDVSRILQCITISYDELDDEDLFIMLYNLLFYLHRDKFQIIYIDFDISQKVLNWIMKSKNEHRLFLLKSEKIIAEELDMIDNMVIINNSYFLETSEFLINEIHQLIYSFHPYTIRNFDFQAGKIQDYIRYFSVKDSSFLINFTTDKLI